MTSVAQGERPYSELLLALIAAFGARVALTIIASMRTSFRSRGDRKRQRDQVHVEIGNFKPEASRLIRLAIRESYLDGSAQASELLDGPEPRQVSKINEQAQELLYLNLYGVVVDAVDQIGRRVDDVFRREGLRQALSQLTNEVPESQAAKQLRERLEREGMVTFLDRSGRYWNLDRYARMAVRTTTAEAQNQAVVNQCLARGFDLVDVIGDKPCDHHPNRPEHPCVRLAGKTLSLTGATEGYEKLESIPPWHPNCQHALLPSVDGVDLILQRARERAVA